MLTWLKKHYHWVIAAVCLIQMTFYGGSANNFSGLHQKPITESLQISQTSFSLAYSFKSLISTLFTFLSGTFLMKFGFRKVTIFALLSGTVFYAVLGFTNSYPMLFVTFGIMGITAAFGSTAAITKVISEWFHKYRGTVLGCVTAATGFGGSLMCILQTKAMETFETLSWRASFFTCSILTFVCALLVILFIKNKPQDMGLVPYGDGEEIIGKKKRISQNARAGLSMHQLLHRPSFYIMILFTYLSCLCTYIGFLEIIPHMLKCGFSQAQSSSLNSFMLLFLSPIKFLMGYLSDRIGPKKVMLIALGLEGVGLALLALVGHNYTFAMLAVAIFGAGLPVNTILVPLLAFDLFGYKAQAQYTGVFMSLVTIASMTGGPLASFCADTTGSFAPAMWIASIASFVMIALYPILYYLAGRDKKYETVEE